MEADRLIRNLQLLRTAIVRDWRDVPEMALTDKEQAALRLEIRLCREDLDGLLGRLDDREELASPS